MDKHYKSPIDSDSLEDYRDQKELEKLRDELKLKESRIKSQDDIITNLKKIGGDIYDENEELSKELQILRQKCQRLEKQLAEKNTELESVWQSRIEFENALDVKSEQLKKLVTELDETKRDLIKAKKDLLTYLEELKYKDTRVASLELEVLNLKKTNQIARDNIDHVASNQELARLKKQLEESNLTCALERQSKDRYLRENRHLERKVGELTRELETQKVKTPENRPVEVTAAMHFSTADEVGEFMDSCSIMTRKRFNDSPLTKRVLNGPQSKRTALQNVNNVQIIHTSNPTLEEKMSRAQELARRNMKTKPLHQTSYALELDTWDTPDITEDAIKRGKLTKCEPVASVAKPRAPVKKAEAFIV